MSGERNGDKHVADRGSAIDSRVLRREATGSQLFSVAFLFPTRLRRAVVGTAAAVKYYSRVVVASEPCTCT